MNWMQQIFLFTPSVQTLLAIALICASGMALAKIKCGGFSLGIAYVFFVGIFAGCIGLRADASMLDFAETFGLGIFIYALGLHVGPNFFGQLRHEGLPLNLWALGVILTGTLLTVLLARVTHLDMKVMVGILCGATTNTPALGAAQQTLIEQHQSAGPSALATAVTYPFGVLGVILALIILRKCLVKPIHLQQKGTDDENQTFIGEYVVENPALDGKTVAEVARLSQRKFIISRLWRGQKVILPLSTTILRKADRLVVVTEKDFEDQIELLFGKRLDINLNKEDVDWNHIDTKLESRVLVVSRKVLNGKRLGQLQLRKTYGVNVSRVFRGDMKLLATDNLRLQYGDYVTVVGTPKAIEHVESLFGNTVQTLNEPEMGSIFFGLVLGLILGSIPFVLPGISTPVKLGIAGGNIIMGIIVGALGPRIHFISYTTTSASLMLRKLGLSLYLGCLGLDAGKDFIVTLLRPEGLLWIGMGALLTLLPVILVGAVALWWRRLDFGSICGILCGAMANPMALQYANDTVEGDSSTVAYAAVYPLSMFIRIIIAQILIIFFV